MKQKPLCKYCGNRMEEQWLPDGVLFNYWCSECGSESPVGHSKKEAFDLATEEPRQKPMTYVEAISQKAIWYETRSGILKPAIVEHDRQNPAMKESYNVIWRGWWRYPKREDRQNAKWDDKEKVVRS